MSAMYLQNKYTKWYFSIISKAKNRTNLKEYSEKHHIVPKSLGGSNDPSNLVDLTAREHFVCHMLLTKMVVGKFKQKMIYAWWSMSNQKRPDQFRYKITSHLYNIIKEAASKNHTLFRHSVESKKKISLSLKNKIVSEETKQKQSINANNRSADHYKKAVETRRLNGSYNIAKGSRENISKALKGKPRILTEEHKANIAKAAKNRVNKHIK
jgi:hypothetical protein